MQESNASVSKTNIVGRSTSVVLCYRTVESYESDRRSEHDNLLHRYHIWTVVCLIGGLAGHVHLRPSMPS
jgi:hypothetical protein